MTYYRFKLMFQHSYWYMSFYHLLKLYQFLFNLYLNLKKEKQILIL